MCNISGRMIFRMPPKCASCVLQEPGENVGGAGIAQRFSAFKSFTFQFLERAFSWICRGLQGFVLVLRIEMF